MSLADKIVAIVRENPTVSSASLAERFCCHQAYVRTALHRAGIFRGKHNPAVNYKVGRSQIAERAVAADRDRLVAFAEANARFHEGQIGKTRQVRTVPEPQLSQLKAQHWRILAKAIRETA